MSAVPPPRPLAPARRASSVLDPSGSLCTLRNYEQLSCGPALSGLGAYFGYRMLKPPLCAVCVSKETGQIVCAAARAAAGSAGVLC